MSHIRMHIAGNTCTHVWTQLNFTGYFDGGISARYSSLGRRYRTITVSIGDWRTLLIIIAVEIKSLA